MFKTVIEGFRAWRRGDKRVSNSSGLRGRVYSRGDKSRAGSHEAKTKGRAELTMKIIRADGSIEYRTVPASMIRSAEDG